MGTRKVRCPTCRKLTRYENKPTIRYGKLAACDDCYARAKAVREGEPPYGPMARVLQWYFDGTLRPMTEFESFARGWNAAALWIPIMKKRAEEGR